jgi:hypothetical protein
MPRPIVEQWLFEHGGCLGWLPVLEVGLRAEPWSRIRKGITPSIHHRAWVGAPPSQAPDRNTHRPELSPIKGLEFNVHRLRHTFACRYLDGGGSVEMLQRFIGHSKVKLTEHHGRLRPRAWPRRCTAWRPCGRKLRSFRTHSWHGFWHSTWVHRRKLVALRSAGSNPILAWLRAMDGLQRALAEARDDQPSGRPWRSFSTGG